MLYLWYTPPDKSGLFGEVFLGDTYSVFYGPWVLLWAKMMSHEKSDFPVFLCICFSTDKLIKGLSESLNQRIHCMLPVSMNLKYWWLYKNQAADFYKFILQN